MAVGDLITAARYNNAQGRVESILGVGSTNEGYGQTVTSEQVSSNVVINATHVNALYTDLTKIFVHQTGGNPNSIAEVEVGDTVATVNVSDLDDENPDLTYSIDGPNKDYFTIDENTGDVGGTISGFLSIKGSEKSDILKRSSTATSL